MSSTVAEAVSAELGRTKSSGSRVDTGVSHLIFRYFSLSLISRAADAAVKLLEVEAASKSVSAVQSRGGLMDAFPKPAVAIVSSCTIAAARPGM